MAYVVFSVFILAPLAILVANLGRGAVAGVRAARIETAEAPQPAVAARRKMTWPSRPTAILAPAIDVTRSLSPLAAVRRRRAARQERRVHVAVATPAVATPPVFGAANLATPRPLPSRPVAVRPLAAGVALPVTASTYGFVAAPASAFEVGPALTPRPTAQVIEFPDRFGAREFAQAR